MSFPRTVTIQRGDVTLFIQGCIKEEHGDTQTGVLDLEAVMDEDGNEVELTNDEREEVFEKLLDPSYDETGF